MDAGTGSRLKSDRKLLRIFFILLVVLTAMVTLAYVALHVGPPDQLVGTLLAGITVSFLISGILSYFKYRGSSLIPGKQITGWILRVDLFLSLVSTASVFIAFHFFSFPLGPEPFTSSTQEAVAAVAAFIGLFVGFLATILAEVAIAFGAIGVMSAVERRLAPGILLEITRLEDKKKLTTTDYVIRWLFAIPDIIDTRLLDVHPAPRRPFVKWRDMFRPLEWQLLFGAIFALYISLNPFIAGRNGNTLAAVFSVMTNGAVLIPVVILPWFALHRLGAGIGGAKKEFTLFNGIRSRLLQTFFAVGTLLLLARVLISGTDIGAFIIGFSSFMATLLLLSLLCTFVYLNYFENDLVDDISTEFRLARPQTEVR